MPCQRQRDRSYGQRGITLAELLLGLGLISVLTTMGAIQVPRLLAALRVPLAARQLATDLHVARGTAIARNARAWITFTTSGYRVRYERGDPRETLAALPDTVHIVAVPRSGTLRFWPTGTVDNGTIVLAAGAGGQRSVVVNQRGRVSIR
jgi:type II secretory pathway pseudopilin PulG